MIVDEVPTASAETLQQAATVATGEGGDMGEPPFAGPNHPRPLRTVPDSTFSTEFYPNAGKGTDSIKTPFEELRNYRARCEISSYSPFACDTDLKLAISFMTVACRKPHR